MTNIANVLNITAGMSASIPLTAAHVGVTLFTGEGIPIEEAALKQAEQAAGLPGVVKALGMPDIHPTNRGIPNGFVLATKGEIYPDIIGRDINCGMRLLTTSVSKRKFSLHSFLQALAGDLNNGKTFGNIRISKKELADILGRGVPALHDISPKTRRSHPVWEIITPEFLDYETSRIEHGGSLSGDFESVPESARLYGLDQLGTLGKGNHFFEVQTVKRLLDNNSATTLGIEQGAVAFMIHTGSRKLGHEVGAYYAQRVALMRKVEHTPIRGIYSFDIDGIEGQKFMAGMNAAANYAFVNRLLIGAFALRLLLRYHPGAEAKLLYDVSHNIVTIETHEGQNLILHRKGATRAFPGQPVLIPGSMGTSSFVLLGTNTTASREALHSVPHGAGRIMTRREALGKSTSRRRPFSMKDFKAAMWGIELISANPDTIKAEAPQVYKPIHSVINVVLGAGLATGVAELTPIGVIKD